jgi:hypothetical protein
LGSALAISAPVALDGMLQRTAVAQLKVAAASDPLVAPPGYFDRIALVLQAAPKLPAPALDRDPDFAF